MLDKYIRLPLNYQSKIGYGTVIQNVILEEIKKIKGYYNIIYRYRNKKEN